MSEKLKYVREILGARYEQKARQKSVEVFMPSNIALIKYWGKRREELNLPLVSSLSYTLDGYGTRTRLAPAEKDAMEMNGRCLSEGDKEFIKIKEFLDLFRLKGDFFKVVTENNIPTAAGVASSASGFAALTAAVVAFRGWDLGKKEQSMLARLGSGSAARSFWPGLVFWRKGGRDDGMDCYAEPCPLKIGSFKMAVLLLDRGQKKWSSREAMKVSLSSSPLAQSWPVEQQKHLEKSLSARTFSDLAEVAEENAVLLHRMLETSSPSIVYDLPETRVWKARVRALRRDGFPLWFTQDAGPNLKLLFPSESGKEIEKLLKTQKVDYFIV